MIDQIGIAVFGVTAIALSQSKAPEVQKWASIFGLIGQPFWVWHALSSGAYGVLLLCPLYAAAWARGFWNFWVSPWLEARRKSRRFREAMSQRPYCYRVVDEHAEEFMGRSKAPKSEFRREILPYWSNPK